MRLNATSISSKPTMIPTMDQSGAVTGSHLGSDSSLISGQVIRCLLLEAAGPDGELPNKLGVDIASPNCLGRGFTMAQSRERTDF